METVSSNKLVQPMEIQFKLVHYENAGTVLWQVKFDITETSDTGFATPLLSKNTSSSQTNWFYRDDTPVSAGQTFAAWPSSGVSTNRAANDPPRTMGTCFYLLSISDRQQLCPGRRYLMRAAQFDGDDWGSYVETMIGVS